MNTQNLRLLWALIANLSPDNLTAIPYERLVNKLLQQLNERCCLHNAEVAALRTYLSARETLVRELVIEYAA